MQCYEQVQFPFVSPPIHAVKTVSLKEKETLGFLTEKEDLKFVSAFFNLPKLTLCSNICSVNSTQMTVFSLTQSACRVISPDSSMLDCMMFRLPLCVVHVT